MVNSHRCERCGEFSPQTLTNTIAAVTPAGTMRIVVCDNCYITFRHWLYGAEN